MGKDASELRSEIGDTRERMGETVDAITGTVGGLKEKVSGIVPDASDVKERARGAAGLVRENPLGLLLGAAAVGFLLGSLIPSTRIEDERLGPMGDQLKEQAQDQIRETISTVKDAASQAVSQAVSGITS